MSTEQPAVTAPQPIQDVVAPPKTDTPAEAPLAEPPAELQFTEVTPDPQVNPATPVTVTPLPTTKAKVVAIKKQPKPAKSGPRKPIGLMVAAVFVFISLAAIAYYAYTKST